MTPGRSAIVGHTGFVGGNIAAKKAFDATYNSKNIESIRGEEFEEVIFAGTQARRWWANLHPDADRAGIESALAHIEHVSADRVVVISTIDVLPPVAGLDEDYRPDVGQLGGYGANRLRMEDWFRSRWGDECLVVRLPDLFGPGLKKNALFDLIHDNRLEHVHPESVYQYYDLDRIWADILKVQAAGVRLVQLVTEPLKIGAVRTRYFPDKSLGGEVEAPVRHLYETRHAELLGGRDGYVMDGEEVLARIGRFLESERSD